MLPKIWNFACFCQLPCGLKCSRKWGVILYFLLHTGRAPRDSLWQGAAGWGGWVAQPEPAEAPLGLPGGGWALSLPLGLASLEMGSTWHSSTSGPSLPSHIPPSLSSPLPPPRGSCLHSFYHLAFFLCCFTLYLIIAPHFSLYLKSRIMPVSCVPFRNEIYGNACHWMNCFSLASYFLMITNCLPVQETIPSCSPNFLAFNCNQKLEVLDCPHLWSEVPGFLHQGLAILRVGKRVGNPISLDFKVQIMVHGPNKKGT